MYVLLENINPSSFSSFDIGCICFILFEWCLVNILVLSINKEINFVPTLEELTLLSCFCF